VGLALVGAVAALAGSSLVQAETIQRGGLRIGLHGELTPKRLPRHGSAPVKVSLGTTIEAAGEATLPRLKKLVLAINRHGRIDPRGVPVCEVEEIQPASTERALQACRRSLVGDGSFSASVALGRQVTFPSEGRLLAFNGTYRGRPAILAHVYGTEPIPTSFTLPFTIGRAGGTFATTLTAVLPAADHSYVTGLELNLDRRRGFLSAGCPAPDGFPGAVFPFAKATYSFAGGPNVSSTLTRDCRARG
jgi:hypothetical protein